MTNTAQRDEVQRATQGFVANLSWLRKRPSLIALEVAWRWVFGIPAVALIYREGSRVFDSVPWRETGIAAVSVNQLLTDPLAASATIARFAATVGPGLYQAAAWVAPVLLVLWAVLSGIGRTLVLRRIDPALRSSVVTMIALQLLRMLPLGIVFAAWWLGLRAIAQWTILGPITLGGDPIIMGYVGGVIVLTLGLFVLSALTGWVFSIAPILAMLHGTRTLRSLRDALHMGRVRNGLIEINMVLGIVKIALLVLAMVFSACPLPFQSVVTDEFLIWWNMGVAVWYFLASDFFHVARLTAYLHLWQSAHDA